MYLPTLLALARAQASNLQVWGRFNRFLHNHHNMHCEILTCVCALPDTMVQMRGRQRAELVTQTRHRQIPPACTQAIAMVRRGVCHSQRHYDLVENCLCELLTRQPLWSVRWVWVHQQEYVVPYIWSPSRLSNGHSRWRQKARWKRRKSHQP